MKKKIPFLSLFIIFLFTLLIQKGFTQNIAINSTGNNPDASAMLDIVSADKGLLMPRVSLVSTSDASTIVSPAIGLLVYNNNASITGTNASGTGFYYNSGTTGIPVWTKLITEGSSWKTAGNTGTDSAYNFIGTTDSKSFKIKTKNYSRINISSNGVTTVGNGTDQMKVDSAGHLSFEGTATVYNDIVVPPFSTYTYGSNAPLFVSLRDNGSGSRGVKTFTFEKMAAASEEEVYFSVQMPHNWKEGTTIYPHIHWSPQTTGKNGSVVWGLEYSWVNYNPTTPIAYPTTTIITATTASVNGTSDLDKHLITPFNSITPSTSQDKISGIIMCRLFRNSSAAGDTYQGNASLLSFDFHYEIDGVGSNTQYVK